MKEKRETLTVNCMFSYNIFDEFKLEETPCT